MSKLEDYHRRIEFLETCQLYASYPDPGPNASDFDKATYQIIKEAQHDRRQMTLEEAQRKAKLLLRDLVEIERLA